MLLLSLWFPFGYRARYNAMFQYAVPVSYIFGSLIPEPSSTWTVCLGIAG